MINDNRLLKLMRALIGINSENPTGNEYAIARWVAHYLEQSGVRARLYEFKPKRTNVVAVLPGKRTRKSLLLTPHLDTVPAGKGWHTDPFTATVKHGKLYGLGTTDCKVNLACALEAITSLKEDKVALDYTLIFAATANEESGSDFGLITLLDKGILKPSAAVVLDADDFEIVVAQKGLAHLKIKVFGKRAHGAYPWLGNNAIESMLAILTALKAYRYAYTGNKYLRAPTVNIGTIKGGDKVNVVAGWCESELDFRFLPGTDARKLLRAIRAIVRSHAKKFEIEIEGIQQPYEIGAGHTLVRSLSAAMRNQGIRPAIKGSEGATVITFFQDKGIPAVATGFGCEGCAHMVDEYVALRNMYRGARVLEAFVRSYATV